MAGKVEDRRNAKCVQRLNTAKSADMCPGDACKQISILRRAQKEHQICVGIIKKKLTFSVFHLL